jgi:hypothetical protein
VSAAQWVTQKEAAKLCGCSYDTARRKRKAGALGACGQENPGEHSSEWLVPLTGLVIAGLVDPTAAGSDPEVVLGRRGAERLYEVARSELERTKAELVAARELVAAHETEIKHLRKVHGDLVAALSAKQAA